MNGLHRASGFGLGVAAALLAFFLPAPANAEISTGKTIEILNKALDAAGPDATTAYIGDMGISTARLRRYRNSLMRREGPGAASASTAVGPLVSLWPGGVVPYEFDVDITDAHKRHFADAAAEWATFANVQFVPRAAEADYVLVKNYGFSGGRADLGKQGGEQFIEIGSWNRGTLLHELGHTLGLIHEHQRPDRDTYVTILEDNIVPGTEDNFVIVPDGITHGAYDFRSVMHYARDAFSIDEETLNTIEPKPTYAGFLDIMGHAEPPLSASDRAGIAAMYGAGPVLGTVVTNTQDSGPGSLRAALYVAGDSLTATITFNIPNEDPNNVGSYFRIRPSDQLQSLPNGTTIDGTTQPGYSNAGPGIPAPRILIDGEYTFLDDVFPDGLWLKNTGATVKALAVGNFPAYGIRVFGTAANGNTISTCYLGTNPLGSALPSAFSGIGIMDGAEATIVGGPDGGNLISGNDFHGIELRGAGTTNNVVTGNFIGTDPTGQAELANGSVGVLIIEGSTGNAVGGSTAASRNIISGNAAQGFYIGDAGTSGNKVIGNYVGLDVDGDTAIGNWVGGVVVDAATNNEISANVVSGNELQGLALNGAGTQQNKVSGNYLGTNAAGTVAAPNGWSGIAVYGEATLNEVGPGNVISGNTLQGVVVADPGTEANHIFGNRIGTNAAGVEALPNGWAGIEIANGATDNEFGGLTIAERNVISGNTLQGVLFSGSGTDGNVLRGNFIGLSATGLSTLPNNWSGIELYGNPAGPANTVIGGSSPGARNFISGNLNYGIVMSGSGTTGNIVRGNSIGLDVQGGAAGNAWTGVGLFNGTSGNEVGGTGIGEANRISHNDRGVDVLDAISTGNRISRNSIYGNAFDEILLYNGLNDDSGNNGIASPALSAATVTTQLAVAGTYPVSPAGDYAIEFFASPTAPPSGWPEGRTYLGSVTITSTGSGTTPIVANLPQVVSAGVSITATATDSAGNTSIFSGAVFSTMADTDSDGMPDLYETANGLNAAVHDAASNKDGDAWTNLEEFVTGTDPQSPGSRLQTATGPWSASGMSVRFNSVLGRIYRVDALETLGVGALRQVLSENILGTGGTIEVVDPGALGMSRRFYEVVVSSGN